MTNLPMIRQDTNDLAQAMAVQSRSVPSPPARCRARSRGREGGADPRIPASWGCAGSRTPRTPSGSLRCAGTGTATGLWSPRRRAPPRDSPTCPLPEWSPSSTLTEAPAPSSRPPTTGTSRASASTASSDADAPLPELRLRVGVYGHFAPVDWRKVFDGPDPGVRLMGEEPESTLDTNQ